MQEQKTNKRVTSQTSLTEYGYNEALHEAHVLLQRQVELKSPNIVWHLADTKFVMDNYLNIFQKYFRDQLKSEPLYFEANTG